MLSAVPHVNGSCFQGREVADSACTAHASAISAASASHDSSSCSATSPPCFAVHKRCCACLPGCRRSAWRRRTWPRCAQATCALRRRSRCSRGARHAAAAQILLTGKAVLPRGIPSGGLGRAALAAPALTWAARRAGSWERPCSAAQRCGACHAGLDGGKPIFSGLTQRHAHSSAGSGMHNALFWGSQRRFQSHPELRNPACIRGVGADH